MKDGMAVWLPCHREQIPGLPDGLSCAPGRLGPVARRPFPLAVSELPRHTTTHASRGDHLRTIGPDTALARVLTFFEHDGFSDPSQAWQAFTMAWNWAAPLTTAVPAVDSAAGPVARPEAGGFSLSGRWHLPPDARPGQWLVLPVVGHRQRDRVSTADSGPDLFVVPAKVLAQALRDRPGDGRADESDSAFRLDDVPVPAGFATYRAGTPLRPDDTAFVWTAVTAMALGAARRMTDTLAGLVPGTASTAVPTVPPAAVVAELAAVLHDERVSLAATLHRDPRGGGNGRVPADELRAGQVERAGRAAHHVVAAAYQHALPMVGSDGRHPLVHLVGASAPILQQVRYAVELLPRDDRTCARKADHGDDGRISG